jgi:hypothetical protein
MEIHDEAASVLAALSALACVWLAVLSYEL